MTKDDPYDWDTDEANNEEIAGIPLDGNVATPADVDDAVREIMAQWAALLATDSIASDTTTDLSTVDAECVTITGTTTITGLGTLKAGALKFLTFAAALTLTHNASSLILPGGANITTSANACAVAKSLGSGNWQVLFYQDGADAGGDVTGPGSATDENFALFDGATGKVVKEASYGPSRLVSVPLTYAGTVAAHTGTTSVTTIKTVTIPGGAMGPNGFVRISTSHSNTPNANNKQLVGYFGGTGGILIDNRTVTTTGYSTKNFMIRNRGSESSQIATQANINSVEGNTAGAATGTVDTSADVDIVFRVNLSDAGDTVTLEHYVVEVFYVA